MVTFKIDAKFKSKILVPYAAIENSFEFASARNLDKVLIITNDGRTSKMKYHKEVNILSSEAAKIIAENFPKLSVFQYLSNWYERCNRKLYSLAFQYIELDELDNPISVPAKVD